MEQNAGQILVQRIAPVTTTRAGDVVMRYARQMQLLETDTARELNENLYLQGKRSISLAVNADSLATWFLEALVMLLESTGVVFDICRDDQEHTTSLLRSGEVMAAVTSIAAPVQGCTSEKIGVMRYRAVCSPSFHDRWLSGSTDLTLLRDAPVVNFDRKDILQDQFFRTSTRQDLQSSRHFIPTSDDFVRAVLLGFGWGLLPEQQCLQAIETGRLLELASDEPVDVDLYWQRWKLASPLLDAITDAVRTTATAFLHH